FAVRGLCVSAAAGTPTQPCSDEVTARCAVGGANIAGGGSPSRTPSANIRVQPRYADLGPLAGGGVNHEVGVDEVGPLTHDVQAHPLSGSRLQVKPAPIVGDAQAEDTLLAAQHDPGLCRVGVLEHVVQRLLRDAVQRDLHVR